MVALATQHDGFRYDPEAIVWLEEFELRPVQPDAIRSAVADGQQLVTMDIPEYLGRSLAPTVDTGTGLYRLVQLFGTPNVPGLAAGADQPDRVKTTWHYLFRATHDPTTREEPRFEAPDGGSEHLLSVYDLKTNLSVGLSTWVSAEGNRIALEPEATPLPDVELPDGDFMVALVQLVLSAVEHAVSATYKELWV